MNIVTMSPLTAEYSAPYLRHLGECFQIGEFAASPWVLDARRDFISPDAQGKADPRISFVFANRPKKLVERDRIGILRLVQDLYNGTSVKFYPASMEAMPDDKIRLTVACGPLALKFNDWDSAEKSTVGYDRGDWTPDLRNMFRTRMYQALFEGYDVTDIEFKNFPLPFKPDKINPVKFHNAGNTPCP